MPWQFSRGTRSVRRWRVGPGRRHNSNVGEPIARGAGVRRLKGVRFPLSARLVRVESAVLFAMRRVTNLPVRFGSSVQLALRCLAQSHLRFSSLLRFALRGLAGPLLRFEPKL